MPIYAPPHMYGRMQNKIITNNKKSSLLNFIFLAIINTPIPNNKGSGNIFEKLNTSISGRLNIYSNIKFLFNITLIPIKLAGFY